MFDQDNLKNLQKLVSLTVPQNVIEEKLDEIRRVVINEIKKNNTSNGTSEIKLERLQYGTCVRTSRKIFHELYSIEFHNE